MKQKFLYTSRPFLLVFILVIGCSNPNKDWQDTVKKNSIEAYSEFLQRNPESNFDDTAKQILEELEWKNAIKLGTDEAYESFLQKYPQDHKGFLIGWNLKQLLQAQYVGFDGWGTINELQGATIDFALNDEPILNLIQILSEQKLKFDSTFQRGYPPAKVIFTASSVKDATAMIPAFNPKINEKKEDINNCFVESFIDYPGKYNFNFGLRKSGFGSASVAYLKCFSDGSEHHFFGEVKLFGSKFKNDLQEPLIFTIDRDNYVYVSGKGSVMTEKGNIINFP